jgi:4'-phosphopantetheinyl transferase
MSLCALHLHWAFVPDFSGVIEKLQPRLSAEEQQRATRLQISDARQRFILARVMLRHQLGNALGIVPESLSFATGRHGKPHLDAPGMDRPPHFNLTHSGGFVALVIADDEVGVDIENSRPVTTARRLAHRFFCPEERKQVFELEGEARDRAFLRIWTQKEAYLKAIGLGVGMSLRGVETEPNPAKPPGLLTIAGDPEEAAHWTLLEADIPGALCTVAVRRPAAKLRVQRFTPADLVRRSPSQRPNHEDPKTRSTHKAPQD